MDSTALCDICNIFVYLHIIVGDYLTGVFHCSVIFMVNETAFKLHLLSALMSIHLQQVNLHNIFFFNLYIRWFIIKVENVIVLFNVNKTVSFEV